LVGGGEAAVASTKGELEEASRRAQDSGKLTVIEVKIPRDDMSPQLARIAPEVVKVRGWKLPAAPARATQGSMSQKNCPAASARLSPR
jgi:hypothetical protein